MDGKDDNIEEEDENAVDTASQALPALTFSSQTPCTPATAKLIQAWFKACLGELLSFLGPAPSYAHVAIIHGIKKWSSKKWNDFIWNQDKLFENFPLDSNSSPVALTDFTQMKESHLQIWIRHLANSFSEGTKHSKPFRFLNSHGKRPTLSMLRPQETESSSGKRKRGPSRKASAAKRGKRTAKKSRSTVASDYEYVDEESENSNDEQDPQSS